MRQRSNFIIINTILFCLFLITACANEESTTTNADSSTSTTTTTTPVAPTVTTTTPSDGTGISTASEQTSWQPSISVTFSIAMKVSSISTNTADTTCSGTIQVSRDNFTTCARMNTTITASNSNKTFTLSTNGNLTSARTTGQNIGGDVYKLRVTTTVQSSQNVALASTFTQTNGFKISACDDGVQNGDETGVDSGGPC